MLEELTKKEICQQLILNDIPFDSKDKVADLREMLKIAIENGGAELHSVDEENDANLEEIEDEEVEESDEGVAMPAEEKQATLIECMRQNKGLPPLRDTW